MTITRPARFRRHLAALSVLALLGAAACSDDDGADVRSVGEESGSGSGSGSDAASGSGSGAASGAETACEPVGDPAEADVTVAYELREFAFDGPDTVAAGAVAFEATNAGTVAHELAVIRLDGDIADLPTTDDGNVDEAELPDGAFVGEIEAFPAGESCTGVFDLEAGDYALVCLVEESHDGEGHVHFAEGMAKKITVG